jgi:small subunit ribosomal protein S21
LVRGDPADTFFRPPAPRSRAGTVQEPRNERVIKVQVRANESLEAALRRFKRQCNYSGVFRLAKAHTWHEKRSDKRRRERRERLRIIQKASRRGAFNARTGRRPGGPRRSSSSSSSRPPSAV